MSRLTPFLKMLRFTHAFRNVMRDTLIAGTHENDAEHSFQLTLMVWYVATTTGLELDLEKALKYALAHDLVEVYAGDVSALGRTLEAAQKKTEAEREALLRIEREFPEFAELTDKIKGFEARQDPEARFVYALDKLLPVGNIYLDGGRAWRNNHVTLDMLESVKNRALAASPEVEAYWQELRAVLEQEPALFEPEEPG